MKTLEEIKDEVAKENGYDCFSETCCYGQCPVIISDEATKRFAIELAKEALKNASENGFAYFEHKLDEYVIDKESILNENNIPKI